MEHELAEKTLESSSVIASLLPVAIGGLLAIGGAFSGTLLTYLLNQRSQRKKIKREKLEQLLSAANKTEHWLDQYKNTSLRGIEENIGPSPISEVEYLSALYVNELSLEVTRLSYTAAKYFEFIATTNSKRLETGSIPGDFVEKYKPIYGELSQALSALLKKARQVASEI